jgi:hypothetical protein
MMEADVTRKAAWSLLLTTRLFGIVDENSSPLHRLFCVCVSISALFLGTRVILINLKGMSENTATPTLDLVALIYQVCIMRNSKICTNYFYFLCTVNQQSMP